jgi:predicted ATP-binding protein involved in virulence
MKPLNSLVVISWHTPWKCVRVLVGTTCIRLSEDNHDSWVTCTTSAECKTVITAVLTVMSGMDSHCYMNARKERGSDSENFGTRITGFGVVVQKIYENLKFWGYFCGFF